MNLAQCRAMFEEGLIDKPHYIEEMYRLHSMLFDYADYLQKTDIATVEIQDGCLIMTSRKNGIKLWCETLDKRAAPIEILNFHSYEQTDSNMIFDLLESDMVFFDIGANIGWYSMNIAKQDHSIQIYAFEPIPNTYKTLTKNIALNDLHNIHLYNMGLSDSNQDLIFYFDPKQTGNASARNLNAHEGIQKIVSPTQKLDDFFNSSGLQKLDFIKCDVEGAELLVFQGGIATIKAYQPIIFAEMLRKWSKQFNYHPNEIIQLLREIGYRCFTAKNGKLIEFFVMDENTPETNFFFLHAEKHHAKIDQESVA